MAYLQDQVQNVVADNLDSVLHDDSVIKLMLLSLINDDRIKGIRKILSEEQLEKAVEELEAKLLEELEGINYFVQEFNFDKTMDLLRLIPEKRLQSSHFEMMLALFKAKKFFEGRKPTIDDVKILSDRISTVAKN